MSQRLWLQAGAALRTLCVSLAVAPCALLVVPAVSVAANTNGRLAGHSSQPPYWLLHGPGVTAFGAFAGYIWNGPERSVSGSWTVPRVMPHSRNGVAGTWIGAQAPGGGHAPFIQIGVTEIRRPPLGSFYFAFYSDTKLSFHPHLLFLVRAGDAIAAQMHLRGGHWHITLVDETRHRRFALSTKDDTRGDFNQAEWVQEDVSAKPGHVLPYPQLATIRFRRLRVNSFAPPYSQVRSQWMSENGEDLAPSPLVNDAFSLAPTLPTAIGEHYLQIAVAVDVPLTSFEAELARWTVHTSPTKITSERLALAAAFTAYVQELSGSQWPARAQQLCDELVAGERAEIGRIEIAPTLTSAGILQWVAAWARAEAATSVIAQKVRRALDLPQIFPLPGFPA